MKYLTEYRDKHLVQEYLEELHAISQRHCKIMEVCGGQTHGLVKNGILEMLPQTITMVHGPGCPVCVTPVGIIDESIYLASLPNLIVCSFGDMVRVPGSQKSLLEAKAQGGDVRIVYSPLEAVKLAKENPDKEVVFFAVGFETTAPANALSVIQAEAAGIYNFSILTSHVLVPPAMEAILSDGENNVNAFLAAGHVCTIMGMEEYYPIAQKYLVPIVVTGFEPVDLLQGILMCVRQLESGRHEVENQYIRYVKREGNNAAMALMNSVFEISDREWRGMGNIPQSGFELKKLYENFNARKKFKVPHVQAFENSGCISGEIMKGIKKPFECINFGKACRPEHPVGAPMVSSEGACAAYYNYST